MNAHTPENGVALAEIVIGSSVPDVEIGEGGQLGAVVARLLAGRATIRLRVEIILQLLRHRINQAGRNDVAGKNLASIRILDSLAWQQTAEIARAPGGQRRIAGQDRDVVFTRSFVIGKEERLVLADGAAGAGGEIIGRRKEPFERRNFGN